MEVTNGPNWGKFLVARFDEEWELKSELTRDPLLRSLGWWSDHYLWVLDLQTGEGALFSPGGHAHNDLKRHAIWVCPMYEPYLEWLYQWWRDGNRSIAELPRLVELPNAPFSMHGYRRPGPSEQYDANDQDRTLGDEDGEAADARPADAGS